MGTDEHLANLDKLANLVSDLGNEEIEVLLLIAHRLHGGQRHYGIMAVEKDPRDYERERGEELADVLVYTAMHELRRLKRGGAL